MDDLKGRKALLRTSGLKGGRILDIGMGDCGCMSFFLARRGFDVIGIDNSPNAVHDSRKDAQKKKFKGSFEARLANAESLPFNNNEFDAISAYHSMHHMDNLEKVIYEMFRVCKNGGHILISDLHEKGRKAYEHEDDNGEFLKKLEEILSIYTDSIQRTKTKYNMIFICKKNSRKFKRKAVTDMAKKNISIPRDQLTDMIRKKAYELYEKKGKKAGQDLNNWLEAEKLIKQKI